ncbi:MAG: hypothetical protein A2V83_00505 [Nitrospirae bacterium RBG_16_64_22]|nr:MAG: hypothetical protein A2V83_00505 [Nitrospirae bacterium RBG_16_64_22]
MRILPESVVNRIAAGEVVERPAAVVKELAENALDAGATRVRIEIRDGGRALIRVTDDGCGMTPEEAFLSLQRHATSKIRDADDLWAVSTFGFRGEALSSIAAVSRFRLRTAVEGAAVGAEIKVEGGKIVGRSAAPPVRGTVVEGADLFFNQPARLKFLKSIPTELSHVMRTATSLALGAPSVSFQVDVDGRASIDWPGGSDLLERTGQVLGRETAEGLVPLDCSRGNMLFSGYLSAPAVTRGDRRFQEIIVNGRPVRAPLIVQAVYRAYEGLLMKDRHPFFVLNLVVPLDAVDVNVHPQKLEVRFRDSGDVFRAAVSAAQEALGARRDPLPVRPVDLSAARDTGSARTAPAESGSIRFQPEAHPRTGEPVFSYGLHRGPEISAGVSSGEAGRTSVSFGDHPEETPVPAGDGRPRAIGQVLSSFIVAERGGEIWIVDQHAAHERVLFEKIRRAYGGAGVPSQSVLFPLILDVTPEDRARVEEIIPVLQRLGFEVEPFGPRSFRFTGMPAFFPASRGGEIASSLVSLIGRDRDEGRVRFEDLAGHLMASMACHPAVRMGDALTMGEMDALLSDLESAEQPQTCPHGRPTRVRITLDDLKRMFRR